MLRKLRRRWVATAGFRSTATAYSHPRGHKARQKCQRVTGLENPTPLFVDDKRDCVCQEASRQERLLVFPCLLFTVYYEARRNGVGSCVHVFMCSCDWNGPYSFV